MTKIFVSYRRDDSADVAGRIYDRLIAKFGRDKVFKDVDSIPLGVDFKQHLEGVVQQCAVELVLIGKQWLDIADDNGHRRLDDPRDSVRIEIESALAHGIPVIPLLVSGASMPPASRPPRSLIELTLHVGTTVRHDSNFSTDMDRVITAVQHWLSVTRPVDPPVPTPTPRIPVASFNANFTLPLLEWINIPAGKVTLEENAGTYAVEPFARRNILSRIRSFRRSFGMMVIRNHPLFATDPVRLLGHASIPNKEFRTVLRWWKRSFSPQSGVGLY